MRSFKFAVALNVLLSMAVLLALPARGQVNTVTLSGTVYDPQERTVSGAKVTVTSATTGAVRTVGTGADGAYEIIGLPPGRYTLEVEAAGFTKLLNSEFTLTLGQNSIFDAHLTIASGQTEVTVSAAPDFVDTVKSAISNTVTQSQINDLPINGRNYINFTLLDSQANRDNAPSIGPAPTSGLNFGGQRARSNAVSVDGADAVDNSTNGVRTTVSQEAVQEFQLITSSYMPEYGRATGGVVNIVTKSGSNQMHGNLFGYLRDSAIQARNPFSVQVDPATGIAEPVKQSYTRVQGGATIGGPIRKDKTFYFASYEGAWRQETGFTDIGAAQPGTGAFGLVPSTTPALPGVTLLLTPAQQAFVNNPTVLGAPGGIQLIQSVFGLAGSGSSVALGGIDPGIVAQGYGLLPGPGARFPVPIDCIPGTCTNSSLVNLPGSFTTLNSLIGNYPISEGTSLYSLRLDQIWNPKNTSSLHLSISPSLVTGIQSNAQNQNLGENAGSRVGLQQTRDWSLVFQHTTAISDNMFNEFRYQFARRGIHFGYSNLTGGSNVGVNIPGFAFFGREPFSTVDRIERRNQWTDNLSWVKGRHSIKMGVDTNLIQILSNDPIIFQLDFGGLYNFGALTPGNLGLPTDIGGVSVPEFSAVQAYGLGIPQNFIQGVGSEPQPHFNNKTLGVFLQDSWKLNSRLTFNYGVRYDIEFTPTFAPATALNAAAEKAEGVVEGIPVDPNNIQPRVGFAWDPSGSGKTVIRGGYGIFYDHPLLAIAFNSTTADGARNSQLILPGGAATGLPLATNPLDFNGSSIFQGTLNTTGIAGISYLGSQQRFDPFNSSFFNDQNYLSAGFPLTLLPFTFPVAKNFVYGYAQQASLGIEREFSHDWKIGATYNYTHGTHLNRPRDINSPIPAEIAINYRNAIAAGFAPSSPLGVAAIPPPTLVNPVCSFNQVVPGLLGTLSNCLDPSLNGGLVATAAAFNYFRPSGPNPSFGYSTLEGLLNTPGIPTCFGTNLCIPKGPGVAIPYSSIDQQESSGGSVYNALTVIVQKRFSNGIQLYSSYTFSHAIDDSTDLQSLLEPQNDRFTNLERANSTFDQRSRWITSAVFQSPYKNRDEGFWKKLIANSLVSPIIEVSSGRPFTVLTGTDYNLNFASNTDRPSVVPVGTPGSVTSPFINNVAFTLPTDCSQSVSLLGNPISPPVGCDGNLGRNPFTRPGYFDIDLRLSRTFPINERWNVQLIADAFNLLNRLNVADVNPLCDPGAALSGGTGTCSAGQPTAALDPRQFEFALKISF